MTISKAYPVDPVGDESESHFQNRVVKLARLLGWKAFHLNDPMGSPAGFPDLLLRRPPRLIWAELKSQHGRFRPEQREFLADMRDCGQETYEWRPSDWDDIKHILASLRAPTDG